MIYSRHQIYSAPLDPNKQTAYKKLPGCELFYKALDNLGFNVVCNNIPFGIVWKIYKPYPTTTCYIFRSIQAFSIHSLMKVSIFIQLYFLSSFARCAPGQSNQLATGGGHLRNIKSKVRMRLRDMRLAVISHPGHPDL